MEIQKFFISLTDLGQTIKNSKKSFYINQIFYSHNFFYFRFFMLQQLIHEIKTLKFFLLWMDLVHTMKKNYNK